MTTEAIAVIETVADVNSTLANTKFTFRAVTDEKTKVKTKRPDLLLPVKYLTLPGLLAVLSSDDTKSIEAALGAVNGVITGAVRNYLADDATATLESYAEVAKAGTFEFATLAALPRGQRTAAIDAETWTAFSADYNEVMLAAGVEKKKVDGQLFVYTNRFQPIRGHKDMVIFLNRIVVAIAIWAEKTNQLAEFVDVYDYIKNRCDVLLKDGQIDLGDAL